MTEQNTTILPKKRGLGRGLDALFEDTELRTGAQNADAPKHDAGVATGAGDGAGSAPVSGGRLTLPITALTPGKYQPRHAFNDDTIHQLAQSIAQHGIIQPLVVRPITNEPGTYEIIAGERRWRAAQKAMLHDVPVIINDSMTDREALQIGLIENLQREDLNPFDEAAGYQRLMDEFGFTPERLGEMIGKSRSHIANTIRLMALPQGVRDLVVAGKLSAGHARCLIGLPTAVEVAEYVVAKGLSVRATEKLAEGERAAFGGKAGKDGRKKSDAPAQDMHVAAVEKQLTDALGLKVDVNMASATAGRVVVTFKDLDQLDLIIKKLGTV